MGGHDQGKWRVTGLMGVHTTCPNFSFDEL
jgi:hypothetical protein